MKLSIMSEAEYAFWAQRAELNYIADKMKANRLSREEAERIAREDFKRILPDGLYSKDNFLFTARDEKEDLLGFVWFCIRGPANDRRAFVCDVFIEKSHRGMGHGRELMRLAEQEAKNRGLQRMGLHVFGFNEPAIRLYQSLGYTTTDLVMEKNI